MAVTAEQIALNSIVSLIKMNVKEIDRLNSRLERVGLNPKEAPSQTAVVPCIISDKDFDQEDDQGNKYKKVKVTFEQAYSKKPEVLAAIRRLDIPKESDHKFEVRVEDVNATDFNLVCLKRGGNETVVDYASVSYLSVPKV
ncbi:hypothetical protein ElyMa_002598900 [Elysia marginata]|uniref:H-type lectin domain-containing protein n=1 Tax=Elysia marginata TaxID=1093978 RepID=A0AAV4H2X8_9GAST|nr:hypothetical protein ElyMa_002598900 [Elysia marginata]